MSDAVIQPSTTPSAEPEIHTIPDKYYGAALKARIPEAGERASSESASSVIEPPKKSHLGVFIAFVGLLVIVGIGGAYVYFNRDTLLKKNAPASPVATAPSVAETPVTPPPAPLTAPSDTSATSTNPQSVNVSWTDTASSESGFRVERADETSGFVVLTNLPPNSTSFVDNSVQPERTYRYRIFALNATGESTASAEAVATAQKLPPPPPEAPKLPPAGLDTDSDGLTDLEEALMASDSRNPDTDGDGFLDGNEVFHLYNPNGLAPARLLDAKLTKIFEGAAGWTLQVPTPWKTTLDAADGSKATILTGNGESLVISVEANAARTPVLEWYLAKHPEVKAPEVLQYRSKRGYQGILIVGNGMMETYLPWGDRIFTMRYSLEGKPFINFRTLYSMSLNSLELKGLVEAPVTSTGTPLPFEPAPRTPGVINQPEAVTTSTEPSAASSTTSTP